MEKQWSDDELRELAIQTLTGQIFTSDMVENQSDLPLIFTPLMTLSIDQLRTWQPLLLFEHVSRSDPDCKDRPRFQTFDYLTQDEYERYKKILVEELGKLPEDPEEDEE